MFDAELDPGSHLQGLSSQFTSPYFNYVIGLSVEMGTKLSGAGFTTEPSYGNPYTSPEAGWTLSTMAPVNDLLLQFRSGHLYVHRRHHRVLEKRVHDWLAAKYGTITAMNSSWGSNYTSFDQPNKNQRRSVVHRTEHGDFRPHRCQI